jgi:hypothetical protein
VGKLCLAAGLLETGEALLLPGAQILDRIAADAKLDEMKRQRPPPF